MNNVIEILKEIEVNSSRNDKEAILTKHKDNDGLEKILEYSLNPYKVYGIGKKGFAKKYLKGDMPVVINNVIDVLDYLLENNTGSDEDKRLVNQFVASQPEEDQEYYKRIILKDLRIGITGKTVNKIWNELVPTFEVALAEPFDPDRIPKDVYVEYKVDGVRAVAVKKDGKTSMFTRNGKPIEGFSDIIEQINNIAIDNIVIDGELIGRDYTDTMTKVFKKTSDKDADLIMFDFLYLSDFSSRISSGNLIKRRRQLEKFHAKFSEGNQIPNLLILPATYIESPTLDQLNQMCADAVELGYEGVMVKNTEGFYSYRRNYDWMKMKPFEDGDFEIIRIEEGSGRNKGRMGRVVIDVNGVEVGLGSGWDDKERIDMWNNPSEYIGLYVEVQYQEVIEKTGSLRFPSVKGIRLRYDK